MPATADPAAAPVRRNPVTLVAPFAFVGLGVTESVWGITWQPLHDEVGQSIDALGVLLIGFSAGYLALTLSHGRLVARVGTGRLLIAAAAVAAAGAATFAVSSAWPLLVAAAALLGAGFGAVDAGLNAYVSIHHGARAVSFMLAGFGIGATFGPLALTAVLHVGWSWRVLYAALAVFQVGVLAAWVVLRHRFLPLPHRDDPAEGAAAVRPPRFALVLALSLLLFCTYVGAEQGTGTWSVWLLTDRGMGEDAARFWTTVFWGSLAVGRVVVGVLNRRVGPARVLQVGVVGGLVGTVVLWWGGTALAPLGLVIAGLSFAGVFPSLVALTPTRLGRVGAARFMGLQLAAASLGVAALTSLIGVVAARAGQPAIAPAVVALAATLVVLQAVAAAVTRRPPPTAVVVAERS